MRWEKKTRPCGPRHAAAVIFSLRMVLLEQLTATANVTIAPLSQEDYSNVYSGAFAAKVLEEAIKYRSFSTKFRPASTALAAPATEATASLPPAAPAPAAPTAPSAPVDDAPADDASHSAAADESTLVASAPDDYAAVDQPIVAQPAAPEPVFKVMTSNGFEYCVGTESLARYLATR